jgi:hypothetical protein
MTLGTKSCTTTLRSRRRLQRYELGVYSSEHVGEPLPQGGGSFGFRTMTTEQDTQRGEAPVAGRPPSPPTMGFDSPRPCECEDAICLNGLGSSRLNSTLTTEEIANKGIRSPPCHVVTSSRSHPRVAVVGRHLVVTQAPWARQVRLLPRGLWAQSTSGSAAPLQGAP